MTTATPRLIYRRPSLYPRQHRAFFDGARYSICEASTKSGKTAGCMVWLTEQAMVGRPGHNFWWVAPYGDVARIAMRRIMRGLPSAVYAPNKTEMTLTFANRATVWFKSGENPEALYGDDVRAAVIDEATRLRPEAWYAVRTTLTATGGLLRIIGNVKGRKNWAYQLARRAEAGEPDMHYAKITAYDAAAAGIFPYAEIESARADLPEAVFKELYLAEPSEDGGNPFGLAAIAACVAPLSLEPVVAWGWDLAKSQDWTVGVGLDVGGRVAGFHRWNMHNLPAGATGQYWDWTVREIRRITGSTAALVDATSLQDAIVEQIAGPGPSAIEGFVFGSRSKQELMERLAVAVQQQEVTVLEGVMRLEMEAFEYEHYRTGIRYAAPGGAHDDCVVALALARRALDTRRLPGSFSDFPGYTGAVTPAGRPLFRTV